MQYSFRIFVAALLILSAAQVGPKALALPLPSLVAQASFPVPDDVPADTRLAIQSSPNLGIAAQSLKDGFETTYAGTEVGVDITSSDEALAALRDGDIDLAAIGRPLTQEESAEGFVTVPLERAKIAIIIGPSNPFNGSLTFEQFAAMFRGEITDWSEVGGAPGPIRFVDRPESSDTRRSLSQYDVFQTAPFVAGATAEAVGDDDTATVIAALGDDGISYAIAPQVLEQEGVAIVPMHQTLPDDPRYPYSQPRYFVYRGTPSPAVAAFLGYATSSQGSEVLATAQQAEAAAVATALGATNATAPDAAPGAAPEGTAADVDPAAGTAAAPAGTPDAAPGAPAPGEEAAPGTAAPTDGSAGGAAWWWILPLLAGLGGLGWLLTRQRGTAPAVPPAAPPPASPPPPVPPPAPVSPAATVVPPVAPLEPSPAAPVVVDEVSPAPVADPVVAPAVAEAAPSPAADPAVEPAIAEAAPSSVADSVAEPAVAAEPPPVVDPGLAPEVPAATPDLSPLPVAAAAGAAGLAVGAVAAAFDDEADQLAIEARKFDVVGQPTDGDLDLSSIDDGLPPLPDGYGDSRIVLMPRDPQWAYTYWDTPHTHKEELRRQGGERLALRLYDVTDMDRAYQSPHSMQQFECDELARDWYLPIPLSDRDYQVDIGYLTADGRWLVLASSNTIRIPPIYPSDWSEDHFRTVTWEDDLRGKTLITLGDPQRKAAIALHDKMYALSQASEADRIAGSLYGSMQHVPGSGQHVAGSVQHVAGSVQHVPGSVPMETSSHVAGSVQHVAGSVQHIAGSVQHVPGSVPYGAGFAGQVPGSMSHIPGSVPQELGWMSHVAGSMQHMAGSIQHLGMVPGQVPSSYTFASGIGMMGGAVPTMSGMGLNVSGLTMSGINMSGVGFWSSMPPIRPRKFWLVADAELIVYGATEPDATVTIGGQPIRLSADGTFRFQLAFPDGRMDYPIMAVAVDGEQTRYIHMAFNRDTPERRTNTKEEAQDEWFPG